VLGYVPVQHSLVDLSLDLGIEYRGRDLVLGGLEVAGVFILAPRLDLVGSELRLEPLLIEAMVLIDEAQDLLEVLGCGVLLDPLLLQLLALDLVVLSHCLLLGLELEVQWSAATQEELLGLQVDPIPFRLGLDLHHEVLLISVVEVEFLLVVPLHEPGFVNLEVGVVELYHSIEVPQSEEELVEVLDPLEHVVPGLLD